MTMNVIMVTLAGALLAMFPLGLWLAERGHKNGSRKD